MVWGPLPRVSGQHCVVRSVWLGYLPTWKPLSHTCHPPSTSLTLDSRLCTSFSLEPQLSALQHQRQTLQAALWLGQGFSWLPPMAPRESHGDWSCSLRASQLSFTPPVPLCLGEPAALVPCPSLRTGFWITLRSCPEQSQLDSTGRWEEDGPLGSSPRLS